MSKFFFTYIIAFASVVAVVTLPLVSLTPKPAKVLLHKEINFTCKITIQNNWRTVLIYSPFRSASIFFFFRKENSCGVTNSADDNIDSIGCNFSTGEFRFTIRSMPSSYHNKYVKCSAQYGPGGSDDIYVNSSSQVYIELPLENISLLSGINAEVEKDKVKGFTCQANSRPDTNITWEKVSIDTVTTILPSYQPPAVGTTVTSYMNYTGNVLDDGANIFCHGQYYDITKKSDNTTLIIIYAPAENPKIQMVPSANITTGDNVTLTCTVSGGNPLAILTWNCSGTPTNNTKGITASYSVTFTVNRTYNKMICSCTTSHPVTSYNPSVHKLLEVFYPPVDNLIIQQSPAKDIIIGNTVILTCMVSGGNPIATLSWNCSGIKSNHSTETIASYSIQFNATKMDNNRMCACTATHSRTPYRQEIEQKIIVFYPPDANLNIQVVPADNITINVYVTLTCTLSGGNPLPNLSWNCSGHNTSNISGTISSYSVGFTVDKTYNNKICTCTATHFIQSYKEKTEHSLVVYFGPEMPFVSFTPKRPWFEGNSTHLTCVFEDGNPNAKIRWKNGDSIVRSNDDNLKFEFHSLTSNNNGMSITCIVYNLYAEMVSERVVLDVQYFPKIMVDKANIVTNESNNIFLFCNASGNPIPRITWTVNKKEIQSPRINESSVLIENINRTDSGNYTCKATSNSIKYGNLISEMDTQVVVNYAPDVIVTKDSLIITQNTSLTLSCNATGRPAEYAYEWKHTFAGNIIRVINSNNNSLLLTNLSHNDIGKYECFVNNGIKDRHGILKQWNSTDVEVQFKPWFVFYDKVSTGKTDRNVSASVDFIAFPAIEKAVEWRNTTNNSILKNTSNIFMTLEKKNITTKLYGITVSFFKYGYVSSLNFPYFDENQDGFYNCEVANSVGVNNVTLRIIYSDRPEPPIFFSGSVIGSASVTLTWKKGFNGGNNQTFVISYWKLNTVDKMYVYIAESSDKTYEADVSDLTPSTSYIFHIKAENIEGFSDSVNNTITLSTKAILEQELSVIGPVAGGVGGIVVAGLLVVGVYAFRRKFLGSRKKTDRKNLTFASREEDDEDGLKDNELYVSAGENLTENSTSTVDVYAVIKKPNDKKGQETQFQETGLYAEVRKKKDEAMTEESSNGRGKQTGKPISKGKLKKKNERTDDVYENITEKNTKNTPMNKNKDGLVYADLVFKEDGKRNFIIRGIENKTNYADIDLDLKADPLPSDESDEENGKSTENVDLNKDK